MAKIYLIRHGEVENNIKDIFGGDSKLTERGKEQAKNMANYLRDIKFSVIYHSPKKRARNTSEIIADIISNIKLVEVPELNEMNYGELEGLSVDEINERFPGLFKERAENKYYWKLGGENFEDIRNRIKGFLNKLKSEEGSFVIVGHQMTNRTILGELLNLSADKIPFIITPNDAIYEIDLTNLNVWNIHKGVKKEGLIQSE